MGAVSVLVALAMFKVGDGCSFGDVQSCGLGGMFKVGVALAIFKVAVGGWV